MKNFALALLSMFLALPAIAQTGSGSYTVHVDPPALTLIPPNGPLPNMTVGVPYTELLQVAGGTPPYVSVAVTAGALPAGVKVTIAGATVTVAGTPTAQCSPDPCSFTLTVTGSNPPVK
jgi:hypothetical protein